MKSVLKWASMCLVVYCIFLVIKLPAVHALSYLPLGKNINIRGVSGSIWQGHVQSAQVNGLPIRDINWSLSFFPLLLGEISADVKAGNLRDSEEISISGHLSVSEQQIQAESLVAYVPVNLLVGMLSLPIKVQVDGRLKVQVSEFDYQSGCQQLSGQGQLLRANYTSTTGVIKLGNFNADLSCQEGSIVVNVKQPNSFGLSAKAIMPADMKLKVTGRFKPEANLPEKVHQAAQFFGRPDADGYYPIDF